MREVKFRAWLLKENKMVVVDTLANNKGYGGALEIIIDNPKFNPSAKLWEGENRPCDSYLNHSMEVHKERSGGDDFILLQYTGLKDKNGKEIYEGDILKMSHSNRIMEFFNNCFWLIHPNREWKFPIHMVTEEHLKETEIIGNIYENANLLK